jgi:hypothetical protein
MLNRPPADGVSGCSGIYATVARLRWNDLDFDFRRSSGTLRVSEVMHDA